MLFSSLVFIFVFLPIVLAAYYILPKKLRNLVLLVFSLVFYAWGGVSYALILVASILVNYGIVKRIEKSAIHKRKWLITGLVFDVGVIVVFKYLDFFIENINDLGMAFNTGFHQLPYAHIVLPLGISFFTFQQMSMLWDVYRNPQKQKITFLNTALYISFFPQLIAGPIVRYNDIIDQIRYRKGSVDLVSSGIQRFILGLFKKIVFANSCGALADSIVDNEAHLLSTPVAWLGIVAYAFQIYFDFSGYSDMAIGLGRMFGFRILENFNFPYISTSIQEFWRRWHISLSTWFRDYVYIPLGGNRQGPYKTYFNLIIVFLLTGFWHGATWSFVFWGIFHGTFLVIERLGFGKFLKRIPKIFGWGYAMLVVLIGWVFFRIEDFSQAFNYVGVLFGVNSAKDVYLVHYLDLEKLLILLMAAISSTTILKRLLDFVTKPCSGNLFYPYQLVRYSFLIGMFLLCVLYINSGSYNPFIYFRF